MSLNAKVLLESRCRWLYQYFIIHIHTHTYIYIYIHKYMVNCAIKTFPSPFLNSENYVN